MMDHTGNHLSPFPFSDTNKRYYTYDYWLRHTFGEKCAKVPIDAGFSCPNLDGTKGYGGCTFCSGRGSGDFAESPTLPIAEQYRIAREKLSHKWSVSNCIVYFQAHTNTYAPTEVLRGMFEEALTWDGVVGINIATRADCLSRETVAYLADLAKRTVLTVELGLQSSDDATAARIHRGHTFAEFCEGYRRLREASPNIRICVHLIFGLPGENAEQMMQSVHDVAILHPDQVKFHLLHVLSGTRLGEDYERGAYIPMERDVYIDTIVRALERIPQDVVVCRLTGDGNREELLAPLWSRRKRSILNDIDQKLATEETQQGKYC